MKTLFRCFVLAAALSNPAALRSATPPEQGTILIPRLGVEGNILEGADDDTLRIAVGHIPGTALPGGAGNAALAAHRYGYFKGLRRVRMGDRITVRTAAGTFHYAVDRIEIVEVTDVSVLAPTPTPTLTLVTCYPFDYIGPAPQRLIVRAHRLDDDAGSTSDAASTRATPGDRPMESGSLAEPAG
jgi:sortase A